MQDKNANDKHVESLAAEVVAGRPRRGRQVPPDRGCMRIPSCHPGTGRSIPAPSTEETLMSSSRPDPQTDPQGDPQTHLDTDPVNQPDPESDSDA